ncbi:hypothetical protein KW496_19415 [Vibrio fluvialis]|nr:hypothetical protein [Vibrio fluvialis]
MDISRLQALKNFTHEVGEMNKLCCKVEQHLDNGKNEYVGDYIDQVIKVNRAEKALELQFDEQNDLTYEYLKQMLLFKHNQPNYEVNAHKLNEFITLKMDHCVACVEKEFFTELMKYSFFDEDEETEIILQLNNMVLDLDSDINDYVNDNSTLSDYYKLLKIFKFRQMYFFTEFLKSGNDKLLKNIQQALIKSEYHQYLSMINEIKLSENLIRNIEISIKNTISDSIQNYYFELTYFLESFQTQFENRLESKSVNLVMNNIENQILSVKQVLDVIEETV